MMTLPLLALAQMNQWVLPPNEIDFTFTPPTTSTTPANVISYRVSNSAHDENGNLLFTIVDASVFDPTGASVGQLNGAKFSSNNYSAPDILTEIALFPLPGSCDTWCAFYLIEKPLIGIALAMTEITIKPNGSVVVQSLDPSKAGIKEYFGGTGGGLALSPPINGSYANRNLYVVSSGEVDVLSFSGTVLPPVTSLATYEPKEVAIVEADLSHDGNKLAWGDYFGASIYTMDVGPFATPPTSHGYDGGSAGIAGLEFSADNNNIIFSTHTGTPSLRRLNIASGNFNTLSTNIPLTGTQLEMAQDGLIYFVKADENLGTVSFPNYTVSSSNLNITLNSNDQTAYSGMSTYSLPDQIDGQDYNQMMGVEPLALNDVTLNGGTIPSIFTSSGLPEFGLCAPINLELDYEGTPTSYTIDIHNINPTSGVALNCNNPGPDIVCASQTIVNPNSFPLDLNCLINNMTCDLFDAAVAAGNNTYEIEITIESQCESIPFTGFFKVIDIPNNANGVLSISPGNGAPTCNSSQNINNPCVGGTLSTIIDLTSSTGTIQSYQINIDEVNCTTGTTINTLYSGPQVMTNNPGAFTLASLQINGDPVFFYLSGWLGRCLRIEATVGNDCGSTTDFTFFQFDGEYLIAPNTEYDEFTGIQVATPITVAHSDDADIKEAFDFSNSNHSFEVISYPNPVQNQMNLKINSPYSSEYDLELINSNGQLVQKSTSNLHIGKNILSLDLGNLPSGVYFYQLKIKDKIKTGKIIKVQ